MRKTLLTLLLAAMFIVAAKAQPTIIEGNWNRSASEVSLFRIISGRLEVLSTYKLQENRNFAFALNQQEAGFYLVGSDAPGSKSNKFTFYLKPGDNLQLAVNEETYELTGKNTPENLAMKHWYDFISPMEFMAVYFFKNTTTYVDFFPLLEEKLAANYTPLKTKNTQFDAEFENYRKTEFLDLALHFLFTPRSAHPHTDELPDFYREVNVAEVTKTNYLMNFPFGSGMLMKLLYNQSRFENNNQPLTTEQEMNMITNEELKGELLLGKYNSAKTYLGFKDMEEKYGQYILTPDQKRRAASVEAKLAKEQKDGEPAIPFTYKDIDDKDVSLSDFLGKVVLIDVWATWCGPCIAQIPHLKKMIEDYKGKDVVFMSVSVDEVKDLEKWKGYVIDEGLGGVQLFAGGFQSDIARLNGITGIPRFVLIDKQGNMVSKDAPRPSTDELRTLIDSELKK